MEKKRTKNIKKKIFEKTRFKIIRKLEKKLLIGDFFYLLRKLYFKINVKKDAYISHEYKAMYFPICKVASSSLGKAFLERSFKTINKKKSLKKNPNYFKFAFVRNPYDRLVSCYVDKIIKRENIHGDDINGFLKNNKQFNKKMSFKEFVRLVDSIKDKKADPHFRSQFTLLSDNNGELISDFIGKFENLKEDYKKICEKIGIKNPPELPHKRKSKRKDYKDYYDEEIKNLVQERYKKDFELFGYSKEF